MHYKQVTSGNWKFEPLAEKEPFNAEKERQKMEELYSKARTLRPLFNEVKEILMKYHVNLRDINKRAYDFYFKMQKEEQEQFNE